MPIVSFSSKGSFDNIEKFLKEMLHPDAIFDAIDTLAQEGVVALESATPRRTGFASGRWYYTIKKNNAGYKITWHNDDIDAYGVPIVILIQYGHGTGTGGYVEGYDFINPVTKQVFDSISDAVWKAVQSA